MQVLPQSTHRIAPRFSDASLHVLLQGVRKRREVLFPADRKKKPSRLTKEAWMEIAAEVTSCGVQQRDWVQCRKRMNDLLRTAKEKKAHNSIEMSKVGGGIPDIRNLTAAETEALELAGDQSGFSISDAETGVMSIKRVRAVEVRGEVSSEVLQTSSEEESAQAPEESAQSYPTAFLSTAGDPTPSAGKRLAPDALYAQPLKVMQVQLMEPVKNEGPESPTGGQAHPEPEPDSGPLMSATLSLLELQQRAGESLAELPKALSHHARSMEESLQDMRSAIAQSSERMASSLERLAMVMETQVQQNTQCMLGVSANLQTIALAVRSLQQWPNGRCAVRLDPPGGPPPTEGRERPEEPRPAPAGEPYRDGLSGCPAPLPVTGRLQRKRPQRRLLD
ncbi:uncharacterized protein LOC121269400 [Carcharodon carcharias]|uniref:uncharacterized protein LOC121269400 n=1 Tax=Carcharodon carcharias TaxID=13397 RepID=UPI001B7DFA8E|nr:uncharacterized protein LOC121269400 [Carcharodon carcharias]